MTINVMNFKFYRRLFLNLAYIKMLKKVYIIYLKKHKALRK